MTKASSPNCHPVSHARRERTEKNEAAKDRMRREIDGKPNWTLNGHQELACKCGQGPTMRRARRGLAGIAIAWLEGACENCGPVALTAGQWRIAQGDKQKNKPDKVVKILYHDEQDAADWRVGNPLTYHDRVSTAYGNARFGQQEGFHGALVTRFGLLKEKSWHRDRRDAERDVLQVFCSMHALAMEQRRRAAGRAPTSLPVRGGPPPLAVAA